MASGGQRAALVEVDARIAEALGAEFGLQRGHRRVAVGDDDALVGRLFDEIVEGGRARMAHDLDAVRLGGHRLLELGDHRLGRPGRELRLQIDAERLGGLRRAGLAGQRRPVAGVAAHLHVHHQPFADRIGGPGRRYGGDKRSRADADKKMSAKTHVRCSLSSSPVAGEGAGDLYSEALDRDAEAPPNPGIERRRSISAARRCGSSTYM